MPSSDPTDILIFHDRWATRQILDACAPLTREQLHRRFEIGPGSLHDTTTHIVGSMLRWVDFLTKRPDRPRLEGTERTVGEIIRLLDEVTADFAAVARAHPFGDLVSGTHNGRDFTLARGVVISHVLAHGTHHRAQCVNMLRHTGVNPLPKTGVRDSVLSQGVQ